jgi:type IV secretory pathway TraG/TraD family ATPase VirD4
MADQEWGRAERVIFPPHQPIYTYGAIVAAFILTGFLIWIHFLAMTPLQQAYTPAYFKSGMGALTGKKAGKHEFFMVTGGIAPSRPATEADVIAGSTPSAGHRPIPLELSDTARKAGLLAVYRGPEVSVSEIGFHLYLRDGVFQGQGFWEEYRATLFASAFLFFAMLPLSIKADIKRRKEMKYGRLLRGPVAVTPAQFNEQMSGDGFGFQTEGMTEPMRIPQRMEAQHIMIMGDTGAGKTTLILQLLRQIEERGEMAIVYDPAGEFTKAFYNRERGDMILNPLDARCPYWGPYEELRTKAEAATLAKSLYQPSDSQRDEFFTKTPQKIFAQLLQKPCTPRELAEWMANPEEIDRRVAGTVMERMIPKDSPNQRNGVLASLGLVADTFEMLPTIEEAAGRRLVITEWAKQRQGWLFITSRPTERDALKPIISLWLDWLILQLLSAPTPDQKPVYLVIDELASLQRLPQLHTALTESRKSKNPLILGFQGKDQMDEVYGPRVSSAMLSQPATKIFLRTTENVGSEWISKMIGKIEIERVKETHSGGTNAHKTFTVDRQIDAMVMESEISGLEDKIAYMKLGNRVVRFNFPYVSPPKRTEAFIQRRVKADELATVERTPQPAHAEESNEESVEPPTTKGTVEQAPSADQDDTRLPTPEKDLEQVAASQDDDSSNDEPPPSPDDALPPNPLFEED